MARIRPQRVAEALRVELSRLIQQELKDPRLGFVSIVSVEMSNDLRHAKIYVSVYGDEQAEQASLEALRSAQGFLRREVTQRLRLRLAPELQFIADPSIEHGAHISALLREIKKD